MKLKMFYKLSKLTLLLICFFSLADLTVAQGFDRMERSRMKDMLGIVKDEVKKNYYDPTFRGIDLDDRFKKAQDRLDQVTSTTQALAVIAQVLVDFNDSHLFFIPPATNLAVEYGWRMQAVGDRVYVTSVKPGSDAEAKGIKPGDQVLAVSGFRPSKKELWKVLYFYNGISKRDRLKLTVLSPGEEKPRDVEVMSEMKQLPRAITFQSYFRLFDDFYEEENDKHRMQKIGSITVWRMPSFVFDPAQVDQLMDRVKNGGSLILDLRGNGGGLVETMERLTGFFFDKDIKIADLKGRKPKKPMLAKTRGKDVFNGKLIVMIDAKSGSASEIFARLVQLEGRGKVIGDVSAGAVMQSRSFSQEMGTNSIVSFGVSVTDADVIMSDGKSLETTGVIPDELVLPTGADLAAGRDPVLAHAAQMLGATISPEAAGGFYKYYWKKN
jgi:carboxyl-terminal processing protease